MRCPYCGGLNSDQAKFCARCGRDMTPASMPSPPPPSSRPPYSSPSSPSQRPPSLSSRPPQPAAPRQTPPASRSRPAGPAQSQMTVVTEQKGRRTGAAQSAPSAPPIPPAPVEPPAPFPPSNIQQLQALEVGALAYTVLDESESYGRKKIVRIGYPSCTGWQQVATLYKVLKAYRSDMFDTILIYGISPEKADKYNYTNGMVQYDQHVRLGSQILNRYQIETENGFSSDAVRIVLTEE